MLIVGAKGFAKELLQYFHNNNYTEDLCFFDNVSEDIPNLLYNKYPVIKTFDEVREFFQKNSHFVLGVGNPRARFNLSKKMIEMGGQMTSVISNSVEIGTYGVRIGVGTTIMSGTIITNDIQIGNGTLINLNCTIGHDSIIGVYCELSPGVHVSGHVTIDDFTSIGTGAVIIPNITIGKNCIIGAGSVVNKNIPDNSVAVGVPAKVIKEIEPFNV